MKKKATKKVQDTEVVKVIPPYPRWVEIYFVFMCAWAFLDELVGVEISKTLFWLSSLLVIFGYGIYRAFRYFPRRAFCVLALLVVGGISLLISPVEIQRYFFDSRLIIFLVLGGLIVGQGILALFWKKVRKWGWFIFYIALFLILVITGQVYDYLNRPNSPQRLCGGHFIRKDICSRDKPIVFDQCASIIASGSIPDTLCSYSCRGCNDLNSLSISNGYEKEFKICPNRENVAIGNGCYRSQLKECPEGFIRAENGDCVKRQ